MSWERDMISVIFIPYTEVQISEVIIIVQQERRVEQVIKWSNTQPISLCPTFEHWRVRWFRHTVIYQLRARTYVWLSLLATPCQPCWCNSGTCTSWSCEISFTDIGERVFHTDSFFQPKYRNMILQRTFTLKGAPWKQFPQKLPKITLVKDISEPKMSH